MKIGLHRSPTGVPGLDDVLGGGLPESTVLGDLARPALQPTRRSPTLTDTIIVQQHVAI